MYQGRLVGSLACFLCCLVLLAGCASGSKRGSSKPSREENAQLNLHMGVRYMDLGMLKVAQSKLEKAKALDPDNADVDNALGVFHERIGQTDEASRYFEKAMSLNPDDPGIKNNYGRFLCENGQYEEGMRLLNEAAEMPLNDRKWFALTNLGLCEVRLNHLPEAEKSLRKALDVQPGYAPALLEMQRISYEKREYMSARAFLERYLSVAEHTPESLWVAIQTERALGNRALTEKYQQQLLSMFPTSEKAQKIEKAINR